MIKIILVSFLLTTAAFFAVLAFCGLVKLHLSINSKDDIDDKKAARFAAIIVSWLICGLFLYLAYITD